MSRSSSNLADLASGGLRRLLFRYSWPALVAMSLNALYAVVDRLYIGQGCGEAAMAGLQLAMPVTMLLGAFGVFIGAGHATLLSIKLGEGDAVSCEKVVGQLVALKLLFFLVLPPLLFLNLDAVLCWCGGSGVSDEAFAAGKSSTNTSLSSTGTAGFFPFAAAPRFLPRARETISVAPAGNSGASDRLACSAKAKGLDSAAGRGSTQSSPRDWS